MSTQLALFAPPQPRKARSYVIQGQERPVDLPRLEEGAETMQARVLEWFRNQRIGAFSLVYSSPYISEAFEISLRTVWRWTRDLPRRPRGRRSE